MPSHSKIFKLALAGGFQFAQGKIGFLAPNGENLGSKSVEEECTIADMEEMEEAIQLLQDLNQTRSMSIRARKKLLGNASESDDAVKKQETAFAETEEQIAALTSKLEAAKRKLSAHVTNTEKDKKIAEPQHREAITKLKADQHDLRIRLQPEAAKRDLAAKTENPEELERESAKDEEIAALKVQIADLQTDNDAKDERITALEETIRENDAWTRQILQLIKEVKTKISKLKGETLDNLKIAAEVAQETSSAREQLLTELVSLLAEHEQKK